MLSADSSFVTFWSAKASSVTACRKYASTIFFRMSSLTSQAKTIVRKGMYVSKSAPIAKSLTKSLEWFTVINNFIDGNVLTFYVAENHFVLAELTQCTLWARTALDTCLYLGQLKNLKRPIVSSTTTQLLLCRWESRNFHKLKRNIKINRRISFSMVPCKYNTTINLLSRHPTVFD